MGEPLTIIALGSNLGNSRQTLQRALAALSRFSAGPVRASSFWETEPVDCPPGSPAFLNAVALIEPFDEETPESLLGKLQQLEREFGRQPKRVANESRPLDLDLIAFKNERRATADLTLPHPRARGRKFVLGPLAELAPDYKLPGESACVSDLLQQLPKSP